MSATAAKIRLTLATAPDEDPVFAALRQAPPMSPDVLRRARAAHAETKGDQSTRIPEAAFMAEIAAARRGK